MFRSAARRAQTAVLVVCAAVPSACSAGPAAEGNSSAKEARKGMGKDKSKGRASVLAEPQRFTDIGLREPSGVVYHPGRKHLFVVGDEGVLVELDKAGAVVGANKVKGNLEDVTLHTPTGNLVIISEEKSELIYWDPVAQVRKARWRLDTAALLGDAAGPEKGSPNNGFEGLGFREDHTSPGGGVFYLAALSRQRS
jgi:uncharacterized protein YjiK